MGVKKWTPAVVRFLVKKSDADIVMHDSMCNTGEFVRTKSFSKHIYVNLNTIARLAKGAVHRDEKIIKLVCVTIVHEAMHAATYETLLPYENTKTLDHAVAEGVMETLTNLSLRVYVFAPKPKTIDKHGILWSAKKMSKTWPNVYDENGDLK